MGSENLNRVFIKAYGKGGTSASAASLPEAAQANQDPLLVRFDTATVSIPAPHLFTPPRKPAPSAAPSIPAPQIQPAPLAAAATPASHPVQRHEPVAVAAMPSMHVANVAAQADKEMTAWDETMYSLLFGGATTMVAPNTILATNQSQPIVNQAPSADGPQRSSEATPRAAASPTRSAPTDSRGSASPQDLAHKISSKNQGGEIFRLDRPSYANNVSGNNVDPFEDDESPTAYDMELQQQMMAQSPVASANSNRQAVQSQPAIPSMPAMQSMPQSSAIQNPQVMHYPQAMQPMAQVQSHAAQSGHESKMYSSPYRDSMLDAHERNLEKTKRREQALRQSRMKIFNPLWEVDRLQWPPVCMELSKTMDEASAPVIENLMKACQEGLQVLAITSPQSGEGTSTVACCMAMLAGKHGLNVALVDSNVENPSLSYQTNLELDVDWHEAVAKRMPLEEIAVHSVDDQVTLVPLLERLNAPELNEHNVARMLQELAQSFDLVIVDLGNMSAQKNMVRKLGELGVINAVVAVVDRRLSSPDRIESCLRQIRQTGIASIGLVENFAA